MILRVMFFVLIITIRLELCIDTELPLLQVFDLSVTFGVDKIKAKQSIHSTVVFRTIQVMFPNFLQNITFMGFSLTKTLEWIGRTPELWVVTCQVFASCPIMFC